jgi:class 3 adenylate cyclase
VGKKFCGDCGAALFTAPLTSAQLSTGNAAASKAAMTTPASYTPTHLASRIRSGKARIEGARKIITILFADIKGSMDIMESLGPEESQRLLNPCIQLMMDAVHRVEGTVSSVLGDGVMALFGAPLALEDHAHRALYAALHMHEAVRRYADELRARHGLELQIRVGVNTGDVVVGAIGNNLFMEYTPVGHAVGLAARMETLAAPGSTWVADTAYKLTQHAFRFASRGTTLIKGVSEPCPVYELLGPAPEASRKAARATQGLPPFLGRASELAQLEAWARQAEAGRGQVVMLTGEAGIGKSRLVEELKPYLQSRGFLLLAGEGFAYGKTRAYQPLITMFKRYCGIDDQDPPSSYETKVRATLTAVHSSLTTLVPVFLNFLDAEVKPHPTLAHSAEAKLQQALNGVKRLLALQSRLQPVAFLFEDLHRLDARSLDFLHTLAVSIASLPVFLLCSSRPPRVYPWETLSFSHQLRLAPLLQETTLSLFSALVDQSSVISALGPVVCQRSAGNPFFLEEIVQHLRETGGITPQEQATGSSRFLSEWTLPPTVQSVLASRLDRLPAEAKNLLQLAAVIGQEAPRPVLALASDAAESDLELTLHLLQERELLHESALYPESRYAFKHALTQEVAYHELLQERRSFLHERVAHALETLAGNRLTESASLLAYHYSRSPNAIKALHYLDLAARRASALYADTDAQDLWTEQLRLLAAQPAAPERDRQEIHTRLRLINVLSRQCNDDAPLRAQFTAAEAACYRLGDARVLAELHTTLAAAYVVRGRPQPGLAHARAAKLAAEALDDVHLKTVAPGPLAHLLWIDGAFDEALAIAEAGIDHIQAHGIPQKQKRFVVHPHAQCLAISGACHAFLGRFSEGVTALQQAAALTHHQSNRLPNALVHWGLALVFDLYGESALALKEIQQALTGMEEISPTTGVLLVGSLQEYLQAMADSTETPAQHTGSNSFPSDFPNLTRTWREQRPFHELAGIWLADLMARKGQKEEAHQLAQAALAAAETSGSRWFRCLAHLTWGRILESTIEATKETAETHLRTACALATSMHSPPLLNRTTAALQTFLASGGKA